MNAHPPFDGQKLVEQIDIKSVTSVTDDSRDVKPGTLFVAINGNEVNGENYIQSAIQNGANIIVTSDSFEGTIPKTVQHIRTPCTRKAASFLSKVFYPKQPSTTVAITGTNGKSSVAHFLSQIWGKLGYKTASIGTLGINIIHGSTHSQQNLTLTSPGPVQLHRTLETLTESSVTHCVFEASSHALHQHRLDNVDLQAAAFTNLSQDHLDYHESMASYFDAKKILFSSLLKSGQPAILNADIPEYPHLADVCRKHGIDIHSYGKKGTSVNLVSTDKSASSCQLELSISTHFYKINSPFALDFQIENLLCAMTIALSLGEDVKQILDVVPTLSSPPGRMEHVGQTLSKAEVYVDFAHTPDALERALAELRQLTHGSLHVVFGCGGERDSKKRILMGRIAHSCADQIYITDDNPRGEDPAMIRKQIKDGAPEAIEIADRNACIQYAIQQLQEKDILLIAGKGHETKQHIGARSFNHDDRLVAQKFLTTEIHA